MDKETDKIQENEKKASCDFIRTIINEDLKNNKHQGRVITRFPPEPNGYLHIGHAKSICLNFGIARDYNGVCHLRFDDTNPCKEEVEYVDSIMEDVRWLGFDWKEKLFYASDYFEKICSYAIDLIKAGKAYVCSLTADEIRETRGTLTEAGKPSPYRNRSVEENLSLFEKMKDGVFADGAHVLRAKIDMASPNLNMRDPVVFRIRKTAHHRTGDKWVIYPMYDFTHCISDSLELITHSICTLEFEDHRPLYDWFLDQLDVPCHPQQIEFARLNLTYTVMSKRKLLDLVKNNYVNGWDDPRMPTISGMRRRGFTPESIREFCDRIGVAKSNSTVDIALLCHCLREDLNKRAQRIMAVLNPLKLIITNYPEDKFEEFETDNNPEDSSMGKRKIKFSRELYIEKEDFCEDPPKKFFRLSPQKEVRLMNAYYIKCEKVVKDETTGEIKEIHCTYDPQTKGGWSTDGRKVKGTLHWVSASYCRDIEVRQFDNLFLKENPSEDEDYTESLNPDSLKILKNCKIEEYIDGFKQLDKFQFLRNGYFCMDKDSKPSHLVFNRTITLKDSWSKAFASE